MQEGPLRLELPAGVVDVEAVRDDAGVVSITMEQLDGEFGTILDDRALVADVIGLQEDDTVAGQEVQIFLNFLTEHLLSNKPQGGTKRPLWLSKSSLLLLLPLRRLAGRRGF
mgnify:CR=1 FL=1